MPHPDVDFKGFMKTISEADDRTEHSWSPVIKAVCYNINKDELRKLLGNTQCCSIM